jgi:hypothetical protein
MWERRITLVSSLASLVLLVWLAVSHGLEPVAVPSAPESGTVEFQRIREELRNIAAKFEELRAALTRREELHVALESGTRELTPSAPTADFQGELQAIHHAIQSLADAQADAAAGHQSHNLDEIHRNYPTTNWDACNAVMQRAMAEPGAAERSWSNSDKSPTLHGLVMLRSQHVLERLGAPSLTKIEAGRFVWDYQSPRVGADEVPGLCLEVIFDKGYVWDVSLGPR